MSLYTSSIIYIYSSSCRLVALFFYSLIFFFIIFFHTPFITKIISYKSFKPDLLFTWQIFNIKAKLLQYFHYIQRSIKKDALINFHKKIIEDFSIFHPKIKTQLYTLQNQFNLYFLLMVCYVGIIILTLTGF